MVLGDVVTNIFLARVPLDIIIYLLGLIDQPIILHVHGAVTLLFDGFINNSRGSGVVTMYWSWGLRVGHLLQHDPAFFVPVFAGRQNHPDC